MPPQSKSPLEKTLAKVNEISSLPQVAQRVIEVVNKEGASLAELRVVVEHDPALAVKVLRLVNSAAMGLRIPAETVQKAIGMLGFIKVRDIAIAISISGLFKSKETIGSYSRLGLWRHLVSVGIISRMVALRCSLDNPEEAFLAGLMHDLGLVLMDQYQHEAFVEVLKRLTAETSLREIEREVVGFDHGALGTNIAQRWRFSEVVIASTRFHHASHNYRGSQKEIVHAVDVANYLCKRKKITALGVWKNVFPDERTFEALSLKPSDLKEIWKDMDAELQENQAMIDML